MKTPFLSVIIPVHNEQMRLANCMEQVIPYLCTHYQNKHEIIIVDNGSNDDTLNIARMYVNYLPESIFALHIPGRGKGMAVKRGMLFAQGRWRYMCDVDLSTPIESLPLFFNHTKQYDVVIGSREVSKEFVKTSSLRRMVGRAFHWLVKDLLPDILDTQCGFKLFRDIAAEGVFNRLQLPSMAFDVEALYLTRLLGYRIAEIPVTWQHNDDSRVKLFSDSFSMARDVISIPWLHMQTKIPA